MQLIHKVLSTLMLIKLFLL